jgi:Uma2 family endonuclease
MEARQDNRRGHAETAWVGRARALPAREGIGGGHNMSLRQKEEYTREYTYEEWLELDNNEDTELIDGIVYMRYGPGKHSGPSVRHQKVSGKLHTEIAIFLKGKTCEVYYDLSVRLDKNTTVRPDISIICDPDKLDDRGCNGAPDLVIEILSPSNAGTDLFTKRHKYLMAGVKEYWIVDPINKNVRVNLLEENEYREHSYYEKDIIPVTTLPGCEIDLSAVFAR